MRPGEKLYEELITEGEGITETEHRDIMVLNSQDHNMSKRQMEKHIKNLTRFALNEDEEAIKKELKKIVPEYTPQF